MMVEYLYPTKKKLFAKLLRVIKKRLIIDGIGIVFASDRGINRGAIYYEPGAR